MEEELGKAAIAVLVAAIGGTVSAGLQAAVKNLRKRVHSQLVDSDSGEIYDEWERSPKSPRTQAELAAAIDWLAKDDAAFSSDLRELIKEAAQETGSTLGDQVRSTVNASGESKVMSGIFHGKTHMGDKVNKTNTVKFGGGIFLAIVLVVAMTYGYKQVSSENDTANQAQVDPISQSTVMPQTASASASATAASPSATPSIPASLSGTLSLRTPPPSYSYELTYTFPALDAARSEILNAPPGKTDVILPLASPGVMELRNTTPGRVAAGLGTIVFGLAYRSNRPTCRWMPKQFGRYGIADFNPLGQTIASGGRSAKYCILNAAVFQQPEPGGLQPDTTTILGQPAAATPVREMVFYGVDENAAPKLIADLAQEPNLLMIARVGDCCLSDSLDPPLSCEFHSENTIASMFVISSWPEVKCS
ncbi:hypothetical protein AB0N48_05615 [Micromonospora chalcea]|uniref:hypothetical protein n=1 Tax=Micromonospora chalcea TaxID=1874 RepID=UPI00342AEF72